MRNVNTYPNIEATIRLVTSWRPIRDCRLIHSYHDYSASHHSGDTAELKTSMFKTGAPGFAEACIGLLGMFSASFVHQINGFRQIGIGVGINLEDVVGACCAVECVLIRPADRQQARMSHCRWSGTTKKYTVALRVKPAGSTRETTQDALSDKSSHFTAISQTVGRRVSAHMDAQLTWGVQSQQAPGLACGGLPAWRPSAQPGRLSSASWTANLQWRNSARAVFSRAAQFSSEDTGFTDGNVPQPHATDRQESAWLPLKLLAYCTRVTNLHPEP